MSDSTEQASPRADFVGAAVWIAFGAAVAIGAWRMDRLERLNINPYEAPGLVPGLLGVMIVALGVALALRSAQRARLDSPALHAASTEAPAADDRAGVGNMTAVFVLTLLYALVLVGTGLPFWLVTFAFVTIFIGLLDRQRQATLGRSAASQGLRAAIYGAVWSAIVTLSFQHIFLVRLP